MPSRKKSKPNQSSKKKADHEWIRIRYHLYQKTHAQVQRMLGEESLGLKKYRASYEKECKGNWLVSTRTDLRKEVAASTLVLLGDFHALKQSQRTQLRVMQSYHEWNQKQRKKQGIVLAVEFFSWIHQAKLEKYLKDQMSESEFLTIIEWGKSWGFPWSHYLPLISWAKALSIPIYGINKKQTQRDASSLRYRDRYSAEVLANIREKHPDSIIFVIYGDLHLAGPHLPREIEGRLRQEKTLKIFQNSEKIYFELMDRGLDLKVDVVRLAEKKFCILSVPPWVKWQTYLNVLESYLIREGFAEEEVDYTDQIEQYLKLYTEEFGIPLPEGSSEVFTTTDEGRQRAPGPPISPPISLWRKLEKAVPRNLLADYKYMIENSQSFYIPEIAGSYLAKPSVNHFSELAMGTIYARLSGWKQRPPAGPIHFSRLIWLEAVLYFGTKVVNPRRKTDMIRDIQQSLALRVTNNESREILQLALRRKIFEKGLREGQEVKLPPAVKIRRSSYIEAARLLGGMLGEKLYFAYHEGLVSTEKLLEWLRQDLSRGQFEKFYFAFLKQIDSYPDPFVSKKEKL